MTDDGPYRHFEAPTPPKYRPWWGLVCLLIGHRFGDRHLVPQSCVEFIPFGSVPGINMISCWLRYCVRCNLRDSEIEIDPEQGQWGGPYGSRIPKE
jgi:hypothetical protein